MYLRVLLPKFLAQRAADILPGLALLLTVFNEFVRLKQRRGANLAAEKADALIPCQQLEHVVQRVALLAVDMLAEATTTQFSKDRKPSPFQENLEVAKAGGQVAGRTRKDIESQSNTPVISPKNAVRLNQIVTDLLEGAAADTNEMPEEK